MAESMYSFRPDDGCLVTLRQPCEIRYWVRRLGVDEPRLRRAVAAVGHGLKAVEAWLAGHPA